MPKGSDWVKSAHHLLNTELIEYNNAFEILKNWGMWQYEYGDQLKVNWIQSIIRDELIKRHLWDFENHKPKE